MPAATGTPLRGQRPLVRRRGWLAMDIGTIFFYLIVGAIVGLLGKFFAPGDKDNIPLWLTLVCGIGGMLIGDAIYRAFGGNGSSGLDWTQGIVTIATAAVLV